MSEETTNQQSCGGKKRAMLAYGLVQISATVVSAVSLAAIAVGSVRREAGEPPVQRLRGNRCG